MKSAAIDAKVSTASTARSSAPGLALIPQCTAAERKPVGDVMPPSIGVIVNGRVDGMTSAMEGRQRDAAMPRTRDRADDAILPAAPEMAAGMAVGHDLLG